MQDAPTVQAALPSRWSIVPSLAAAWLVLGIYSAAGFVFPAMWQWQFNGLLGLVLMGATAGWIAPAGRERLLVGLLVATVGLLTLVSGSEWFYYSPLFIPLALALAWAVLALGYAGRIFVRRWIVSRYGLIIVLSCILLAELTTLFVRDGYLLTRYARPRQLAFDDKDPSWFFFAPVERAVGLSYVALQCAAKDPAQARRIFQKAVRAADEIPNDNHVILFLVAQAQVKAGFFEEATTTVRHMRDRFQFELHLGIIASEIARHSGRSQAQNLFGLAIQQAQQQQEQSRRDRDFYLIGYRQWEGGLYDEARQTAELIHEPDSKADLLNRVNDSSQMEIARQQAQSGRFDEAATIVKQHVKDPLRHSEGLVDVAMLAVTNSHADHARRILADALQSTQRIESPGDRNSMIADIALRQSELGFQDDSRQTLALIDHDGIKGEIAKKLSRVP